MWSQSLEVLNPYIEISKIIERELYAESFMTFREKLMSKVRAYFYIRRKEY